MLTVPEAARRVGRNPETVRRWIRGGKLRSQKVGTHEMLPLPQEWNVEPHVNWVKIIRQSRESL